jgi:hypothetical protein
MQRRKNDSSPIVGTTTAPVGPRHPGSHHEKHIDLRETLFISKIYPRDHWEWDARHGGSCTQTPTTRRDTRLFEAEYARTRPGCFQQGRGIKGQVDGTHPRAVQQQDGYTSRRLSLGEPRDIRRHRNVRCVPALICVEPRAHDTPRAVLGFDYSFNAIQNEENELFNAYRDMFEIAISQPRMFRSLVSTHVPIYDRLFVRFLLSQPSVANQSSAGQDGSCRA